MSLPAEIRNIIGISEQVGDLFQHVVLFEFIDVVAKQLDQLLQPAISFESPAPEVGQMRCIQRQDFNVALPAWSRGVTLPSGSNR